MLAARIRRIKNREFFAMLTKRFVCGLFQELSGENALRNLPFNAANKFRAGCIRSSAGLGQNFVILSMVANPEPNRFLMHLNCKSTIA